MQTRLETCELLWASAELHVAEIRNSKKKHVVGEYHVRSRYCSHVERAKIASRSLSAVATTDLLQCSFQMSQETKPPTRNRVDFLLLSAAALVVLSAAVPVVFRMATSKSPGNSSEQPNDFRYYQIYASEDGTTHFGKWKMTGFDLQPYGSKPQYVRSDFGGEPTKLVFTELAVGLEQPLHSCPAVQFVVTLSGSWYVKTTDGTKFTFKPGDVLFQDNTKNSPANKQPEHYSGVVGDQPCQQMIVQLLRPPQVNEPNPF